MKQEQFDIHLIIEYIEKKKILDHLYTANQCEFQCHFEIMKSLFSTNLSSILRQLYHLIVVVFVGGYCYRLHRFYRFDR